MSTPRPITDGEVDRFLSGYALRFDGYKYARSRGDDEFVVFEWADRFLATLLMADDPNENHATYFALQRGNCKWGGETLSRHSREHLAYRLLFLHLYRAEVPAEFVLDGGDYARDLDPGRLEAVAARVREQLIELTLEHGDPIHPEYRRAMEGRMD